MTETGSDPRPAASAPEVVALGMLVRATPALARLGFSVWWRSAVWSFNVSLVAATRLTQAAMRNESPAELLQTTRDELVQYGRQLIGTAGVATEPRTVDVTPEPDGAAPAAPPPQTAASAAVSPSPEPSNGSAASLRARGAELLRRSADVGNAEEMHPAYARILGELAPDEGRILRFLAVEGPQPAVDVRTNRPLNVGSQMVAPGLSMIGIQAGCRSVERVPAYLNNLYRLGLIWFSREPVMDTLRYQVLEVQPDVVEAKHLAGHARTVRRSINLTPFGQDFCETCLPLPAPRVPLPPAEGARRRRKVPKASVALSSEGPA